MLSHLFSSEYKQLNAASYTHKKGKGMAFEQHLLLRLLLLFLTLLPLPTIAQTHRNISLGSSLTTLQNNSLWTSPSGDFAFGFQQIEEDGFLLAIWFNQIQEKTIVWYANGQNLASSGSKVELTSDGQFWLKDPSGVQIWNANIQIHYAALLDTGNLILVDKYSAIRWQSFDHPTDTILPGQVLSQESKSAMLVSRYLEGNFSMGRFQFTLQNDGNLVLNTLNFPLQTKNYAYWSTDVLGSKFSLVFNQSGNIFLQRSNGSIIHNTSSSNLPVKDFYHRAILEYDGVFRHYVYPKISSSSTVWSKGWNIYSVKPPNICLSAMGATGSGACGFNSYCTFDVQRKVCHCPQGYNFIDPNDVMKGCKQDFASQSCDEAFPETHLFDLYEIQNTDWVGADCENFQSVTEDWCRQACLGDCFCAAVIFRDGDCFKKRQPLSNGRIDPSFSGKALMKIRIGNSTLKPDDWDKKNNRSNSKLIIIGSVLLSTLVLLNLLLLAAYRFGSRKSKVDQPSQFIISMNLTSYTYEELSNATNGFNEELGRGGFAIVYKGVIQGLGDVAVKKLQPRTGGTDEEFRAELSAIGQTSHRNLVRLVGFCDEGEHRLLVYEFMSNGSLASFLFGAGRLEWHQRKEIALGIARGLSYLHNECHTQIIHRDIKPENILLDGSYRARISDLGIAKLLKAEQTRTYTEGKGTRGYAAPECIDGSSISVKVDVYSYGILLLELISCKNNFDKVNDQIVLNLGNATELVKKDPEASRDKVVVERYVRTALRCIQKDPSDRPTMKEVLLMLEGSVDVRIPRNPAPFPIIYDHI